MGFLAKKVRRLGDEGCGAVYIPRLRRDRSTTEKLPLDEVRADPVDRERERRPTTADRGERPGRDRTGLKRAIHGPLIVCGHHESEDRRSRTGQHRTVASGGPQGRSDELEIVHGR